MVDPDSLPAKAELEAGWEEELLWGREISLEEGLGANSGRLLDKELDGSDSCEEEEGCASWEICTPELVEL